MISTFQTAKYFCSRLLPSTAPSDRMYTSLFEQKQSFFHLLLGKDATYSLVEQIWMSVLCKIQEMHPKGEAPKEFQVANCLMDELFDFRSRWKLCAEWERSSSYKEAERTWMGLMEERFGTALLQMRAINSTIHLENISPFCHQIYNQFLNQGFHALSLIEQTRQMNLMLEDFLPRDILPIVNGYYFNILDGSELKEPEKFFRLLQNMALFRDSTFPKAKKDWNHQLGHRLEKGISSVQLNRAMEIAWRYRCWGFLHNHSHFEDLQSPTCLSVAPTANEDEEEADQGNFALGSSGTVKGLT